MTNSVRWYGRVLREDGHVWGKALHFEVEGQKKKGRPKMIWKRQVDEESMKVGFSGKLHITGHSGLLVLILFPLC